MEDSSSKWSVSKIKEELTSRGVDFSQCVEKSELLQLLRSSSAQQASSANKLDKARTVLEEVYGRYDPSQGSNWVPKAYADNKSRYLWTDAFGVCNFITLYYETRDQKYLLQADCLINNVHDVLGKDRDGKKRLGNSTDDHPLRGGLRIGKIDPEGTRDGDGQYFHYLTKWMLALNRMSIAKNDPRYNDWAIELVKAIHPRFVASDPQRGYRMFWKLSIDLSKPHVMSEGNLDPYDGYVAYRILQQRSPDKEILREEIEVMKTMVMKKYKWYSSDDPLDLGEALWLAHWFPDEDWSIALTDTSLKCLEDLWNKGDFSMSETNRLAFREFGTTIGVQANSRAGQKWLKRTEELNNHWSNKIFKRDRDITPVMYCTSLIPGAFLRNFIPPSCT